MIKEFLAGLFDGLRPVSRISVSEWAEKYRILSPKASAESGPWRNSRTPYLVEIMDRLSAISVAQKIVFIKGSQIGATEAGVNWIGYVIDIAAKSMVIAMPTDEMVRRTSKLRIQPMIDTCKSLARKIGSSKERDSGNTILFKEFPGGVLAMTGANSAASTKSLPIPYTYLDEVDSYPLDIEGEGDPISLFTRASRTFANRKIFVTSTPTIEGGSIIDNEFQKTGQRYYFVSCPDCGAEQHLVFEQLKWEKGKFNTVKYECIHCNHQIDESNKTKMLASGTWRATQPDNEDGIVYGYHLNSLYSPLGWYSWSDIARDYEDSIGDEPKTKTFVNTVQGLTYKEKGEAPAWGALFGRRAPYAMGKPPAACCFLTAGVDVQRDRLEMEIVGWCENKVSYSIDYHVFLGETSKPEVWQNLDEMLNKTFIREDGIDMRIRIMAIDTGYNTSMVYDYCHRQDSSRVIPIKGMDNQVTMVTPPRAVQVSRSGTKVGKVKVWTIGVSMIKSELYGWLKNDPNEDGTFPPGYCHFPQYEQHYFRGITAEQMQFKVVKGYRKYEWVKKYDRNEPLDCRVYARAAANVLGMDRFSKNDWEALKGAQNKPKQNKPQAKKSGYWDR